MRSPEDCPRPLASRRAAAAGRAPARGCRRGTARAGRPRLELLPDRRREPRFFGMHPALPSTLTFTALTLTALAIAGAVDTASVLARAAAALGSRLRMARGR